MRQRSNKSKVTHGEVENVKILDLLCTEGTLTLFWRACRRRTNLAVGYAAWVYTWLVETVIVETRPSEQQCYFRAAKI